MQAFRDIKTEMRQNCIDLTSPTPRGPRSPARIGGRGGSYDDDTEPGIDQWMEEAFAALITARETEEPFLLLPCSVNGEPTAAIVHVSHMDNANRAHVTPLFVAMTPGMVLIDHKGRRAGANN